MDPGIHIQTRKLCWHTHTLRELSPRGRWPLRRRSTRRSRCSEASCPCACLRWPAPSPSSRPARPGPLRPPAAAAGAERPAWGRALRRPSPRAPPKPKPKPRSAAGPRRAVGEPTPSCRAAVRYRTMISLLSCSCQGYICTSKAIDMGLLIGRGAESAHGGRG